MNGGGLLCREAFQVLSEHFAVEVAAMEEPEYSERSTSAYDFREAVSEISRDESGHVDDCGGCGSNYGAKPKRTLVRCFLGACLHTLRW